MGVHCRWEMRWEVGGSKGYNPLGIVFVLRWQLSPMQVKCTCNLKGSTYIPYGILNKMYTILAYDL